MIKTCSKCGEQKPLEEFTKDASRKDGFSYLCRYCTRKKSSDSYYKKHSPRVAMSDDERKDRRKEIAKKSYEKHRDLRIKQHAKWRDANSAAAREATRRWEAANPEKRQARDAKKRAAKRDAVPKWANKIAIAAVYREAALMRARGENVHVDHIIPLVSKFVCGLHCEDNLRVIPALENQRKSNKFHADTIEVV